MAPGNDEVDPATFTLVPAGRPPERPIDFREHSKDMPAIRDWLDRLVFTGPSALTPVQRDPRTALWGDCLGRLLMETGTAEARFAAASA